MVALTLQDLPRKVIQMLLVLGFIRVLSGGETVGITLKRAKQLMGFRSRGIYHIRSLGVEAGVFHEGPGVIYITSLGMQLLAQALKGVK